MKTLHSIILISLILINTNCAQQKYDSIYVAHWNLENLFDTTDDPKVEDEEFLPGTEKDWNEERLEKKLYNLSRVIRLMNENAGPDILGVCEVENEAVLKRMVDSFLSDMNLGISYMESPDARGIDNGLIFKAERFILLNTEGLKVDLGEAGETRLILHTTLICDKRDTLNVYVNHWPSRRGGETESEWRRVKAATTLRNSVDKIFEKNKNAKVIIIGDFNDEPNNVSVLNYLKAQPVYCDSISNENLQEDSNTDLFNLAYKDWADGQGSYMYKQDFNMLDQIIISRNLLIGNDLNYECNSFNVYKPSIMVTKTGKYKDAPFPTYGGNRYLGGYSDHFPVIAKFRFIR